jgi:hypothetical protein
MSGRRSGSLLVAILSVVALALLTLPVGPAGAVGARATTDRSPVDLATPVDFGAGVAEPSAIVNAGLARFEVLTPTLVRLEYSPTKRFENRPTVNVVDRRMAVPRYLVRRSGGWLTIQTAGMVLRYRLGSGPFTVANTTLQFSVGGTSTIVHPTWDDECTFDQVCQAGVAALAGGAVLSQSQVGYLSTAGFVGYINVAGARATWSVLGAPAGPAVLTLRYSNLPFSAGDSVPRTFDLVVDGTATQVTAAPTALSTPWSTLREPIVLRSGTNVVELRCATGLTGPAPLLPRNVFGVWYSDYTPYSSADIENSLYPAFVAHACRSTPCPSTPTGRRPTTGTAGSGTRVALPRLRPRSSTGRAPMAST